MSAVRICCSIRSIEHSRLWMKRSATSLLTLAASDKCRRTRQKVKVEYDSRCCEFLNRRKMEGIPVSQVGWVCLPLQPPGLRRGISRIAYFLLLLLHQWLPKRDSYIINYKNGPDPVMNNQARFYNCWEEELPYTYRIWDADEIRPFLKLVSRFPIYEPYFWDVSLKEYPVAYALKHRYKSEW